MSYASYTYFEIDTADILLFEQNTFDFKDKKGYDALYNFLQPFYIKFHRPYLTAAKVAQGEYDEAYYQNTLQRLQFERLHDSFNCKGDIYDMTASNVIGKENADILSFQKLFAFKLRQYRNGLLYIKDFLNYHFERNFDLNLKSYVEFLRISLIQFEHLYTKPLTQEVQGWINTKQEEVVRFRDEEPSNTVSEIQTSIVSSEDRSKETSIPEGTIDIEDNEAKNEEKIKYNTVEGKLTAEEIRNYFSFLYREKSENGMPFLPLEQFNEVFKRGISTPEIIPNKRFRINVSNRFPMQIIYFAIYRFFSLHSFHSTDKNAIIKFFVTYFENFDDALKDEKKFFNLSKNIKSTKPKKINFSLDDYCPPR